MKIYSLAVGVCCKASALAASAFATNTYVSAINLHQGSAADLNPYNFVANVATLYIESLLLMLQHCISKAIESVDLYCAYYLTIDALQRLQRGLTVKGRGHGAVCVP